MPLTSQSLVFALDRSLAGLGPPILNAGPQSPTGEQQQAQRTQQAAWHRSAPNAQAQAGWGLSGGAMDALIRELSGYTGGIDQIQKTVFGDGAAKTGLASAVPGAGG
jgi:hypothetical protein